MVDNTAKFKPNFAVVGDYSDPAHKAAMEAVYDALTKPPFSKPVPLVPSDNKCWLNSSVTDFDDFMDELAAKPYEIQSLYICSDLWITTHIKDLLQSARRAGIKTMFEFAEIKQHGGGDDNDPTSWQPLFETAALYVDKILKGTKAGNLAPYTLTKKGKRAGVTFHRQK
jgi:hypothetical protein